MWFYSDAAGPGQVATCDELGLKTGGVLTTQTALAHIFYNEGEGE